MEISRDQPQDDEIEISCFGPGFGESIVCHLGNGEWAIIDSCINFHDSQPASIKYLKSINVDPETQVKMVIATHWHDDHIRGIAETLAVCNNATFFCSHALKPDEFRDIIIVYGSSKLLDDSGVTELYKVIKILASRKKNKVLKFVSENKRIWLRIAKDPAALGNVEIWALSPSDAAQLMTLKSISSLMPADFLKYRT
jgi:ribonuclease BN (tRNA processing enzyme)